MIKQEITEVVATKLAIYPKNIGLTEDEFSENGKVKLIRIIYKKEISSFEYIKIGDVTVNWTPKYSQPSRIDDFPVDIEFKKGDKFILSTEHEIECVELFI